MLWQTDELLDLAEAVRLSRSGLGRSIRLAAGVSAQVVAEACGISASALTRWEQGKRTPSGKAAVRWTRILREFAALEETGNARSVP
jgi:transcriptional regulator with XRE-family HTH domain